MLVINIIKNKEKIFHIKMSENGMVACRLAVRGMLAKKPVRLLDTIVKVQLAMGMMGR